MRCVYTKSKEFKYLSEHYNVSPGKLELIVHKYWKEAGAEDQFPSDIYVMAQLGKLPYKETGSHVIKLWQQKYNTEKKFDTSDELLAAYKEALKYFPKEAVVTFTDAQKKHTLVVRQPMKSIELSLRDMLGRDNTTAQEHFDYKLLTKNLAEELRKNGNFAEANRLLYGNKKVKATPVLIAIDKAITTSNWTNSLLKQIENLTLTDYGRILKRFSQEELRRSNGSVSQAETILSRGDGGTSGRVSQNYRGGHNRQIQVLESWAKAKGLWYDTIEQTWGQPSKRSGSEAMVFFKADGTVKAIDASHYNDVQGLLDKIVLHNSIFPETAYEVIGFGKDSGGSFRVVVKQKYVEGKPASQKDISKLTKQLNLTKKGGWYYTEDNRWRVTDLNPKNVIVDSEGFIYVIDCDVEFTQEHLNSINQDSLQELQMSIESNSKVFTFKDGTRVDTPFPLNDQQKEALNALNNFVHSKETSITLSGYAGTGKTSIMEILAKKMQREHKTIVFSATTNKAAAVLKERVHKAGFNAHTLNKVFGISVEVDSSKAYDARALINKVRYSELISSGDVVVIDEASMINEENYRILNEIAKAYNLKIIYVGDSAQLAPVNEEKISIVFRNAEGKLIELTKVERTGDNAILKEATALRNNEPLSGKSSFNSKGQGVAYIKPSSKQSLGDIVRHFVPMLQSNPNAFRILAYTNNAVAKYNEAVRKTLGYNDYIPKVGEPLVGYNNWGYQKHQTEPYKWINSESYKVVAVGTPFITTFKVNGEIIKMEAVPVTVEKPDGAQDTFNYMDIKGNQANKEAAVTLAKMKSELWSRARGLKGQAKAAILKEINDIEKFLFVNDNIMERGRTLQTKVVDFGYALTVHKSQGSTFQHIILDAVDINKAHYASNTANMFSSIDLEVAGTDNVDFSNAKVTSMESLDFGLDESEYGSQKAEESNSTNEIADIVQQLKYVGVSRATDTVTIITNDVEKEDSPLNHLSQNPTNSDAIANRKEMLPELIQQLETILTPLGNKVHSLADMQKYFQEHPEAQRAIQQAIEENDYIHSNNAKNSNLVENKKNYDLRQRNRQVLYQRFSPEELKGCGGTLEEAEALLLGRSESSVPEKQKGVTGDPELAEKQEKILENWAKEKGIWIDNTTDSLNSQYGEPLDSGGEANVYLSQSGKNAVKEISIAYYIEPHLMLDRIVLHNSLFSGTSMSLTHFGRNENGEFVVVVEQPFVSGTRPTQDEIVDFMASLGFKPYNNRHTEFINEEMGVLANALHDENIIKISENHYAVIDGDFRINTANYGLGGNRTTKGSNLIPSSSNTLQQFTTPQGEVYGFVAPNGDIYLDETKISPEHPIHEYTHLWDRIVAKKNPKLWNRGTELMKQTSEWQKVLNDANYGQKWKSLKGMTDAKLEQLIASEVHARLVGEGGQQLLDTIAKEKGAKGIIDKLKQWILDVWKNLKATFSNWSDDDLQKLTLKDFNHMTMRDFADAITFNTDSAQESSVGSNTIAATTTKTVKPFTMKNKVTEEVQDAPMTFTSKEQALAMHKLALAFNLMDWDEYSQLYDTLKDASPELSELTMEDIKLSPATEKHWKENLPKIKEEIDKAYSKQNPESNTQKQRNNNQTTPTSYEGLITPEENTIFVFGSNPKGIHGAGAAATAKAQFGAIQGQGEGMQGNAYALPTKDLDKAKNTRWYRPGPKEEAEVKEWYKNHSFSEVVNHPLNAERTMTPQQIIESIQRLYEAAHQNPDKQFKISHYPFGKLSLNGYLGEEMLAMFKQAGAVPSNVQFNKEWTDHWNDKIFNTINQGDNRSNNNQIQYSNDFRRVQETVRKSSFGTLGKGGIRQDATERLGRLLQRELESQSSFSSLGTRVLTHDKTGTKFTIHKQVDPQLFHDIFEVVKFYTPNGELVDLHEDYTNCKCYLNEDGTCGFAIEPDGNLVSVFNLGVQKGFLTATVPYMIEQGATHLYAYNSSKQPLKEIYEKVFGAKVASSMDYNMEYDHDDIAKNHGNPQVVFMVMGKATESGVTEKHFTKDQYDEAQEYQQSFLENSQTESINAVVPVIQEETKTKKVSLSKYEQFNNLDESIEVDAEWKVPLLQELDNQLDIYKSAEENLDIIKQMENIIKAESEDSYYNGPSVEETEQQKKDNAALDEYRKLNMQIDALMDNEWGMTSSMVRHSCELMGHAISDMITSLQTEEGFAEKMFPNIKTKKNLLDMDRKEIIETIGLVNIMEKVRENLWEHVVNTSENLDDWTKARLLYENWQATIFLAADTFAMNEGFGLYMDLQSKRWQTTEGSLNIAYDNFNDNQTPEDVQETEGDEQEHWQIEFRTVDVLNSMSVRVRRALQQMYQMDKEGNYVTSIYGIKERVAPRKAVNSILRWTKGAENLNDMIEKLTDHLPSNPWVAQLLTRLIDDSGKEADFQSEFYNTFQKHFQAYHIVQLKNGKYVSMPVNSAPALKEVMNSIKSQIQLGEHPLFTAKGGIDRSLLGSDNTIAAGHPFNLHQADYNLRLIQTEVNRRGAEFTPELMQKATDNIIAVARTLGLNASEEMLEGVLSKEVLNDMVAELGVIIKQLDYASRELRSNSLFRYDPFKYGGQYAINSAVQKFLTPLTEKLEDAAISAFYDSGKMYQSYVTPSFLSKLMLKLQKSGKERLSFLEEEYGGSEWFRYQINPETGEPYSYYSWNNGAGYRLPWLHAIAHGAEIEHKVQLNFNRHNYMKNMTDSEYMLSLITEYFSVMPWTNTSKDTPKAWFRVPIMSNKPSSEFIKFRCFRTKGYKDNIVDGFYDIFLQEVSRIQTVRMRGKDKSSPDFIKSFDEKGRQFNFLTFLNDYISGSKDANLLDYDISTGTDHNKIYAELLSKLVEGTSKLTPEEGKVLIDYTKKAIKAHMEEHAAEIIADMENQGLLEVVKKIEGIDPDADIKEQVENFLWNDAFAAVNILQLTVGDIAFYPNAEELQKRLAQIHAPGIRANVYATDYDGKRVSDGTYRTIILKDFDTFKSGIIANIAEVFDRKIEVASTDEEKNVLRALKESLVGEKGAYTHINVTDAQGYSSPTSYRKKALMFGRWSKEAEEIYQRLLKGDYTATELKAAFQPLKPFVYSHVKKNMGVEGAPITTMNVPFQAKNSEYLLIMADALLRNEKTEKPNILKAIYDVMEDSAYDGRERDEDGKIVKEGTYNGKGIDTVQFESAIKSGLQGKISLDRFMSISGKEGEQSAYKDLRDKIYKEEFDTEGKRVYKTYNIDTYVHEASFDDYCLQQEVPAHFKDHSQAHGSQTRMIVPSDLDMYKNPNGDLNDENNKVYYEWTDPDGTKRKVNAQQFRREYEETIAKNIEEDLKLLTDELHLNSENLLERNVALSKILQKEILSSSRYGVDLFQACSLDKDGNFRIPLGDPIQAKRVEQLLNSVIKSRVNKQKIAGGPIVQVTNFGASKQLHIRFKDRQGNILPLEEEYKAEEHGGKSYKQYLKENQAGIAYFEVFAPIWDNTLLEKFGDANGFIDVKAIETVDPELLMMLSYRIPTEDKYSMAPMKVVGFLPREAGEALMLPYELTEIDDSDFDVDKRYVMRKEIQIKTKSKKEIINLIFEASKKLLDRMPESSPKYAGKTKKQYLLDQIKMVVDNHNIVGNMDALTRSIAATYRKVAHYTEAPVSERTRRNNKIVDMSLAVLTNEMTADKILNPGGFAAPKHTAYAIAAAKNSANAHLSWEKLQSMSTDELKKIGYKEKNLMWADTQTHFYKQNNAGSNLIGVFAVNKVAHATLEGNGILMDVENILQLGGKTFTIAGMEFGGHMEIDPKYDEEGNLIGKTLGSMVSASADTAKDPIQNLMNINMTTAAAFNTLLRLGMPFDKAALFMSQDIISRALERFSQENLKGYMPFAKVIETFIQGLDDKHQISTDSNIKTQELSTEELIKGLSTNEHPVIDYKALIALQKLWTLSNYMRQPTFATRFNSISSAVGPLIIDNLILENKIEQFIEKEGMGTGFLQWDKAGGVITTLPVDIDDVFADHPILKQFSRTVKLAKSLFKGMPANSQTFRNVMSKFDGMAGYQGLIFRDKKLLSSLSDFFQSYILVASGLINSDNIKETINNLPKKFMAEKIQEKYPDNALIQALKFTPSQKTGRVTLSINITGMDPYVKEELGSAWADLHKENPELSKQLFEYCFFRAGIGFSPKTFMSLLPIYVKEHLSTTLPNGKIVHYADPFRVIPAVDESTIIDQWIRNNWNSNKLVPLKEGKFEIDLKKGTLTAVSEKDIDSVAGLTYMKTKVGKETILWQRVNSDNKSNSETGETTENTYTFIRVAPLGNNGEYLEISRKEITKPLTETIQDSEDMAEGDNAKSETDAEEIPTPANSNERQESKDASNGVELLMEYGNKTNNPSKEQSVAQEQVDRFLKNPGNKGFGRYLQTVLKTKGMELTIEEAIEEFKKLC